MKSSAEQIRTYTGPAIWLIGFRPFFLGGAICAALAVGLWLPMLSGHLVLPTAFTPVEWHVHELIFGYVPAVVAGFLLTAVPNWTGRLPVNGRRLQMLFLVWVIGRVAVTALGHPPPSPRWPDFQLTYHGPDEPQRQRRRAFDGSSWPRPTSAFVSGPSSIASGPMRIRTARPESHDWGVCDRGNFSLRSLLLVFILPGYIYGTGSNSRPVVVDVV